jgi:hypothetical protein
MTEVAVRDNTSMIGSFDPTDEKVLQYLGLSPSDPKARAVVAVARRYDLDPILKHVIVIPKGGVYITRDGFLHVAHTSGQLDGIVVDQEPTLSDDGREWVARVSVYRKDMRHPFTYPGRYAVNGSNRDYAQEMALKAAEAHALRRAFNVTGIPAEDEQRTAEPVQQQRVTGADILANQPTPAGPAPQRPADDGRPAAITPAQLTKLHTTFSAVGWFDRDDRLRAASAIVDRQIGTSKDLTLAEASTLIDTLEGLTALADPANALTELIAAKATGDVVDAEVVDDQSGES